MGAVFIICGVGVFSIRGKGLSVHLAVACPAAEPMLFSETYSFILLASRLLSYYH